MNDEIRMTNVERSPKPEVQILGTFVRNSDWPFWHSFDIEHWTLGI
jgi:hypothetical protein